MVGFKSLAITAAVSLLSLVKAETHTFHWTTGYGTANPDGNKERQVITCNGEFPWPDVTVNKGDRVVVYLTNGFPDHNTSLHFHGIFQHNTSQYDGPELVTQCPIGVNQTMVYNFTVPDQHGSYWYHSHSQSQYLDGMRGLFIINDKDYPYKQGVDYDEALSISLTEWYHDTSYDLLPSFLSLYNPTGAEPIPDNFLLNNTRNLTWEVQPDTTYMVRLINIGGFTSYYFFIEDHEMEVIEIDGVAVEKNTTDMIYITVAQRYTFLLKTKSDTSKNFAIMQIVDSGMLDCAPKCGPLVENATSYLVYDKDADLPDQYYVDSLDDDAYLDDIYLTPVNKVELYEDPDLVITLDVVMDNLNNGINYAFFNNITYTQPRVPALLTAMSAGELATNELVYGTNTHSIVLQKDDIIELVINNNDTGKHPFHLHGHVFQLIHRSEAQSDDSDPLPFDAEEMSDFPEYPAMRDTAYVREQSNMVLRFKADNPGVWFFHCHIDWHLEQGLAIVLVEAPLEIQKFQTLSENHASICENVGIPTSANAAGNSDFLDLTGQNVQVKNLPSGFTTKGYVAFVFSCVAGVLGLATISVYGLMDIKNVEEKVARELDIDLGELIDEEIEEDKERENEMASSSSFADKVPVHLNENKSLESDK